MKGYALITGASKGIGRSIANLLAQQGYNVLLVARSGDELEQLAASITTQYKVDARYLAVDLSEAGAADQVVNWFNALSVPLSILINNAGYGVFGRFDENKLAEQMNMLSVNINAVVELTYKLLPVLKEQQQVYILNLASTAAYQAMPGFALYAASKTFILNYSRALAFELKGTSVSVTCLCPGPTDTNFANRAGMDNLAELAEKFNMQPDEVARVGLKALFNKKAEVIPGFLNKLGAAGARHLNKGLIEGISARLYKL
ncbi:SDR family oxidoreductase [Mucilaginibacter corticis]|uniref:SDR family oxidoreductase n=1 Tax=Mucilaginibacter corticis TaxID=2597670 RepID=A0A556MK50_9SPHI|nr:SDR family oxidoreductase [Mucilaginibacter corticis]TSJ40270.1 SDR family oxidoreductase [Mucilaginibacter corticis]